eukprot:8390230-Alexandrium_andersonii.AAC.1
MHPCNQARPHGAPVTPSTQTAKRTRAQFLWWGVTADGRGHRSRAPRFPARARGGCARLLEGPQWR